MNDCKYYFRKSDYYFKQYFKNYIELLNISQLKEMEKLFLVAKYKKNLSKIKIIIKFKYICKITFVKKKTILV